MNIRPMEAHDVPGVAALCDQFGYPCHPDDVTRRFEIISQNRDHQIFVAHVADDIVGWIHVHGVYSISSDAYLEIRGLVVDTQHRRHGVGHHLVGQAEAFALANGYQIVRLRSSSERPEAHHFYPRIGYEHTKTQYHYEKRLIP